jgi:hypothetical protein
MRRGALVLFVAVASLTLAGNSSDTAAAGPSCAKTKRKATVTGAWGPESGR